MVLAFIAICLIATYPGWHEEVDDSGDVRNVKPFPSRSISQLALAATVLATMLALVSMMWQHVASVAVATTAQNMGYGAVKSHVGAASMALGWLGFACLTISMIGLLVMMLSISLLKLLTNE